MRVLVTGGSGFTGKRVVSRLVADGHEVVGLARSLKGAAALADLGATAVPGDLDNTEAIDDAFAAASAETLVNVASLGFGHAPTIIAAAEEAGIGRAVFVSTTAIFTTLPASSRDTRVGAEGEIESSGLEWTIVRPTMIYGAPDDRNMARLLKVLKRTPMFPLPDGGTRLQQPVHVDDLATAIVAAVEAPGAVRRAYNVAGPDALTFRAVVEQAAAAVGRSPRLVAIPTRPVISALRLYERGARRPRIKSEQIERLGEDKAFDIGDARRDLQFEPRPFDAGIRAEAAMLR